MSKPSWPGLEIVGDLAPRPAIGSALFDFDGTLSTIRQGWPEIMIPMFVATLPPLPGESEAERRQLVTDDIMRLNGKQTIYQMIQLAERVRERGGTPDDPLALKHEYLRRLDGAINHRKEGLRSGSIAPEAFLVHAARPFLDHLVARGIRLYLASGTDEAAVRQEADLLGLTSYFGGRIYGARDDYQNFSKKLVIDRILQENGTDGRDLIAFGDGYVEIENTVAVGGLAVAVASDEANNGSGSVDEWKRARLLGVGAQVVIPDYRSAIPLTDWLLGPRERLGAEA